MSHPGIFRLAGDGTRISHLTKAFNLPPLYGDSLSITHEPIHNLTGLVKRYIRDLPEPILDEALFNAFYEFCVDPKDEDSSGSKPNCFLDDTPTTNQSRPLSIRVTVAQILLRLLPPLHFSLFIYLLAFLGQLPLFPDNRLNIESISIIFGPAMAAARGRGIAGLGPNPANTKTRPGDQDADTVSELVTSSQAVLSWLLRHWSAISEKVLQGFEIPSTITPDDNKPETTPSGRGPGLLGPADIKSVKHDTDSKLKSPTAVVTVLSDSANSSSTRYSETSSNSKDKTTPSRPVSSSGGGGGGIFARAFGSRPLSGNGSENTPTSRKPKRSASFTSISSISSLMKKGGGGWLGRSEPKGPNLEGESMSRVMSKRDGLHVPQLPDHCQQRSSLFASVSQSTTK